MTPSPQGTTPSQAPVMSREEWAIRINAFAHAYEMLKSSLRLDKRENPEVWAERMRAREVSILDAIMSLQAEVERLQSIKTQWEMLYAPVCEYVNANQKALGIGLGESISEFVLNMLREKARQPK